MAIVSLATVTGSGTSGADQTIDLSSYRVGDFAMLYVKTGTAAGITVPDGWTALINLNGSLLAYRAKQQGDTVFTFGVPGTQDSAWVLRVFRNAAFGEVSSPGFFSAPTGTVLDWNAVTIDATTSLSLLFSGWVGGDATFTYPASWTQDGKAIGGGGTSPIAEAGSRTTPPAGSLDPAAATLGTSRTERSGLHVELTEVAAAQIYPTAIAPLTRELAGTAYLLAEEVRAIETELVPGFELGQAGIYVPQTPFVYTAGSALVAGLAYMGRFMCRRSVTISQIAFGVTVAASADDACDAAILDAAGNRLVSAGATTGKLNSTGVKTVSLSSSFQPVVGTVYHVAFSSGTQGGTAAQVLMALTGSIHAADLFGAALGTRELSNKGASHPLPATLTGMSASTVVPMMALRP